MAEPPDSGMEHPTDITEIDLAQFDLAEIDFG